MTNIVKILNEIGEELLNIVKTIMISQVGINTNTLSNSNIIKELETKTYDNVIQLFVNNYITFIEEGRKANSKMSPPQPIIEWCKKKGIPSDNDTVFIIRRAIGRDQSNTNYG